MNNRLEVDLHEFFAALKPLKRSDRAALRKGGRYVICGKMAGRVVPDFEQVAA